MPFHGFSQATSRLAIRQDELLAAFACRAVKSGWKQYYRKVGTRRAQAISKVCFAGRRSWKTARFADLRIALGSVAPIVLRAMETENALRGEAITPGLISTAKELLARKLLRSTIFARPRAIACAWRKICSKNFAKR